LLRLVAMNVQVTNTMEATAPDAATARPAAAAAAALLKQVSSPTLTSCIGAPTY
jgi:hypothetical protein